VAHIADLLDLLSESSLTEFPLVLYFNQGRSILIKTKKAMIHRLPITKARVNLGQVARRAHVNKEYFILEKDGIPVIGILDADELEDYLELRSPAVRDQISKSHEDFLAGKTRPADVLLTELRQMAKPKKLTRPKG
jgi:hypothetical protein